MNEAHRDATQIASPPSLCPRLCVCQPPSASVVGRVCLDVCQHIFTLALSPLSRTMHFCVRVACSLLLLFEQGRIVASLVVFSLAHQPNRARALPVQRAHTTIHPVRQAPHCLCQTLLSRSLPFFLPLSLALSLPHSSVCVLTKLLFMFRHHHHHRCCCCCCCP